MSGEHDFAASTLTTPAGATSAAVTGLPLSTEFFVVVRALDEAGNEDDNAVEVSAFTGATSDETPPAYDGVLIAEAQSATQIRLAWDLASDDQTPQGSIVYDVYQSLVLGDYNFNTPVQTSSPGEAFTFVNGLDPETEYFFVVRARDISGNQDSNLVQASAETMPDTTPPVFAGVQQVQGTSATTVGLNWDAGSDDTTPAGQLVYQVFMGPPGAVDWTTPIATTPPGQTNFVVTNLFPEQPFSFGVRALDAYLNADDNTQSLQGSALQDTTPPTFAGVESIGDISWNDGTVFWNAATDDVSSAADIYYEVYAAESGETIPYASPVATTQPGETKFALTGLRPGYDYDVAVRAFDQFGNGEANTSFKTFTTASDVTPPTFGGPTGFAAVAATSLTPEWNLATDNAWGAADISYQVCRSNLAAACGFGAGTWTTHASGTNVTSLALTGLTASTTYYVWVRATDGTGNVASPSNSVSATTSNDVTPPTFAGATGTSAVAGCAGAASFTVSWTAGTDNSTPQASLVYDLWYSSVSGATAISRANSLAPDATSAAGATQYTLTGLNAGTTYYVVVRARDFAGLNDANSVTVSRATAADVCAPTGGNASSASMSDCNTLSVSYGAASDNVTAASAHTYQACVSASSTGCSTTWTTAKSQVGGSSMTVDVANPGTWYVWVRPVDGAGLAGGIGTNRSVALTDSGSPTMAAGSLVLTASNAVAGRVSMSWPQGSDACWSSASIEYQVCNGDLASCSGAGWVTHRSPGTAESTTYDTGLYDEYMVLYVRARDPSGNVSTAKSAGVTTSVHYDTQILGDIWNAKCAGGCHTWTRATTVGQAALCTSGSIITTGTPTNSIMYRLMSETSPPCTRMPYGGPYDSLDWQRLLRWIQQGALDN
jgi:hypothetical protein